MNKTTIVIGLIAVLVIIGGVSFYLNRQSATTANTQVAAVQDSSTGSVTTTVTTSTTTTSGVPLMQSTGQPFAQYAYVSSAHEIFPTPAADATKALGAFSFSKTDLGGGAFRITLTNSNEGYKGQSVVVGSGQTVYFIERSTGDDSDAEDSVTTDDILVAVDAQGNILK